MSTIAAAGEHQAAITAEALRRKAASFLRMALASGDSWASAELRHLAREFLTRAEELEAASVA
jgi:hypothetical protein